MFRKLSQRCSKYEMVHEVMETSGIETDHLATVEEEKITLDSLQTGHYVRYDSSLALSSTVSLRDPAKKDSTPARHSDTERNGPSPKELRKPKGREFTGSVDLKCSPTFGRKTSGDSLKEAGATATFLNLKSKDSKDQVVVLRRKRSLVTLRPTSTNSNSLLKRRSFDAKLLRSSFDNPEMQKGDPDCETSGNRPVDSRLHEIRREIGLNDWDQEGFSSTSRTDSDEKLQGGKVSDASGLKKGKVASFFRKLSFGSMKDSSKSPNTRRSMPVLSGDHDPHYKRGFGDSSEEITKLERSNSVMNEKDLLIRERDKAIEEWTKATSKWEQLLDEVERLMSELNMVKMEKEDKGIELNEVITAYEEDLDKRDFDLEMLRERYIDLNEQVHVARKERLQTLSQYDDLLKKHYDLNKDFQEAKAERETLKGRLREAEQKANSLRQQVDICKHDRDHALRLWNSSVEERKKIHQDMALLIQERDSAIRKAFTQAEELIQIKDERDRIKDEFEAVMSKPEVESVPETSIPYSSNDSGYIAEQEASKSLASACEDPQSQACVFISADDEKADEENLEVFAVFLDKTDSKFGIKVDNAVDDPRVYITHVSSNVASRNNIRKYDRIISVNGVTVVKADRKTVERLIRDCAGRLTLVLQRDKELGEWNTRYKDVELRWGRQTSELQLGLRCNVVITDVKETSNILGSSEMERGDIIHKINSQDVSNIIASLLRKFAKKSGGKVSVRLRKNQEHHEDPDRTPMNQTRSTLYLKAPSITSDGSSLSMCSTSSGQTSTTFNDDGTSLSSIDGFEVSRSQKIREFGLSKKLKQLSNSLSFDGEPTSTKTPFPRKYILDRSISDLGRPILSRSKPHSLDRSKSETSKFEDPAETLYESLTLRFEELQTNQGSDERRRRSYYANCSSMYGMPDKTGPDSWKRKSLNLSEFQATLENKVSGYFSDNGTALDFSTISPYSTLPRFKRTVSVQKPDSKSSCRVLRLEKESHEDLGFRMQGGNRCGIYVADVREGSVASKGGLRSGDKILHLNSYDLTKATMDYAMKVILSQSTCKHFRIEVKHDQDYKKILEDEPLDSVYIRALRSYEATCTGEISFSAGDVLLVTNTLAEFRRESRSWQWFAVKLGRDNQPSSVKGLIPVQETLADFDDPTSFSMDMESFKSDEDTQLHMSNGHKRSKRSDVKKWLLSRKPSLRKKREKDRRHEMLTEDSPCALYEIVSEPSGLHKSNSATDNNCNVVG